MTEQFTYQGHHRIWHVLEPAEGSGRNKFGEPRTGVLRFDRRCFPAEEPLLAELPELGVTRIPAVREFLPGSGRAVLIQDFIEGWSLAEVAPRDTPLAPWYLDQIMVRFRELASVRYDRVRTERRCTPKERAEDSDSAGFLHTLITFTRERGHRQRLTAYGPLFDALGVPRDVLASGCGLDAEAGKLTPRPFCLLHGDLHRANFIVDRWYRLWTIDWELAMVGDPLYDLATHLHLMDYPEVQEKEVIERWCETVPKVLPGADAGIDADLPRYRAYKRVQSAFTDVVRQAEKLSGAPSAPGTREAQLRTTGETVHRLLVRAADVLGPGPVPGPGHIAAAYREHLLSGAPAPPAAAGGPVASGATRRGGPEAASPRGR